MGDTFPNSPRERFPQDLDLDDWTQGVEELAEALLEISVSTMKVSLDPNLWSVYNKFRAYVASTGKNYNGDFGAFLGMCVRAALRDRGIIDALVTPQGIIFS